jgi:hypothetical protein
MTTPNNEANWMDWARKQKWPVPCEKCDLVRRGNDSEDFIWSQHFYYHNPMPSSNNEAKQQDITAKKVLYILETRKTIPSDLTTTQVNEMYANMIAKHIHRYFVLKDDAPDSQGTTPKLPKEPQASQRATTGDIEELEAILNPIQPTTPQFKKEQLLQWHHKAIQSHIEKLRAEMQKIDDEILKVAGMKKYPPDHYTFDKIFDDALDAIEKEYTNG